MKAKKVGLLSLALGLGLGVLGLAVTAGAQSAAPSAAPRVISIATLAPPGSTWMRVFDAWNRELRRRSGGTLALRFYAGGVQGDESEVIRKIRTGRLDGGAVTAVGLSQIHRPALTLQMPGMFRGYAQLDTARNALSTELNTAFQAAGFVHLGWADVGRSRIFSRAPVRTPAELAQQNPWQWRDDRVLPALFTAVGASSRAVALQVPEVQGALQTNRVNALITSPVSCVSLGWSGGVTHMTNLEVATTIGATMLGQNAWNSLTPDQQTMLRETSAQFHELARRNLRSDEQRALGTLASRGITVVEVDAAQRTQWEQVFSRTRQALAGQIADAAFIARVEQLGR